MNSQQMMEEIDRLARLCEAKEADIKTLVNNLGSSLHREHTLEQQLSESNAVIAMQEEVIDKVIPFIGYSQHVPHLVEMAENVLSATSETVAAWRAKETEPLRREVAMLHCALESTKYHQEPVARFLNCAGKWEQVKYDCPDAVNVFPLFHHPLRIFSKALSDTQATALAYEREVENRGAVKALEKYNWLWSRCKIIFFPNSDDSLGTYPIEHNPHARKDAQMFIESKMYKELRARKGE